MIKYDIKGMDKVMADIRKLDDNMKRREILKILRRQMEPIKDAVKNAAPVEESVVKRYASRGRRKGNSKVLAEYPPGNLRDSVRIVTHKKRLGVNPQVSVMPTSGGKHDGWYKHMVIYGTKYQEGNDFVHRAGVPLLGNVKNTATDKLKKYIERKAKKL
jgi:HK97 gp10 family phage protein